MARWSDISVIGFDTDEGKIRVSIQIEAIESTVMKT